MAQEFHGPKKDDMNTPEFLAWRRLHLSKSKLSNCAEMAEIFAGFSVVVTVELQINDEDANPALMVAFVVTTSLLVSVSLLAVMISTCILPHICAVAKMSLVSQVSQSPHDSMIRLIDLCWVLTNTVSLFLFTLDVILMCWIKFAYFSQVAAISATIIMVPVLVVILVFGVIFYRNIISHQYNVSAKKYDELEKMRHDLDTVDISVRSVTTKYITDLKVEHPSSVYSKNEQLNDTPTIATRRFGGSSSSSTASSQRYNFQATSTYSKSKDIQAVFNV